MLGWKLNHIIWFILYGTYWYEWVLNSENAFRCSSNRKRIQSLVIKTAKMTLLHFDLYFHNNFTSMSIKRFQIRSSRKNSIIWYDSYHIISYHSSIQLDSRTRPLFLTIINSSESICCAGEKNRLWNFHFDVLCILFFYTQNFCFIMKIISIKTFIFQVIFSTTVLVSRLHPREDGAFVDRREDEDLLGWIRCDPLRLKILTPWRLFGLFNWTCD